MYKVIYICIHLYIYIYAYTPLPKAIAPPGPADGPSSHAGGGGHCGSGGPPSQGPGRSSFRLLFVVACEPFSSLAFFFVFDQTLLPKDVYPPWDHIRLWVTNMSWATRLPVKCWFFSGFNHLYFSL